jgi:hypothetical protein
MNEKIVALDWIFGRAMDGEKQDGRAEFEESTS